MAEKDYEGQESSGGGGSRPNVANIGSLPTFGRSAKATKTRAVKAVRGRTAKAPAKGAETRYTPNDPRVPRP